MIFDIFKPKSTSEGINYEGLNNRQLALEHEMAAIKKRVLDLEFEGESLRNKVLRKIQSGKGGPQGYILRH